MDVKTLEELCKLYSVKLKRIDFEMRTVTISFDNVYIMNVGVVDITISHRWVRIDGEVHWKDIMILGRIVPQIRALLEDMYETI